MPPSLVTATAVPTASAQASSTQAPPDATGEATAADTAATGAAQTQEPMPTDQAPTSTATATRPAGYIVNGSGNSTIEQAFLRMQSPGDPVYLVIVSGQSTGTEGEVYRDLRQRRFRTTTGPDEGIDTSGEFCYPGCVFVLSEEVNVNGIASWTRVLQHEYRHIIQAENNPTLARDFRDPSGLFTTYGAFMEACADYGLNVAPIYRAQGRMDHLKSVLGTDLQGMLDQACSGDKPAYEDLVNQYEQKVDSNNAFQELFPPYQ